MTDNEVQDQSEAGLVAESEASRQDPDAHWEEQPAIVKVKPSGSEVVSFRIPVEELDRLEEAASAAGQTISQFVRATIALRLAGKTASPPSIDRVASGARQLTIRNNYGGSSTQADAEALLVPDFVPLTVQGPIPRTTSREEER